VGHREDLLVGAKKCLYEKGFARTTARDIVATSGANLASIGYHYGSKDALMQAALISALGDWSSEVEQVLASAVEPHATDLERFEAVWTRMLDVFDSHRPLWAASFEVLVEADHAPELREVLATMQREARVGLAALFLSVGPAVDPEADEEPALRLGAFYQALLTGVMSQWLIDPKSAPTAGDLAEALRVIAARI
jgi:AcrR family transcriptional regulator